MDEDSLFKKLMMKFNNLGVVQIESGRFDDARQCFTLALHLMKTILDQEAVSTSRSRSSTSTNPAGSNCFCVNVHGPSSSSSPTSSVSQPSSSSPSSSSIGVFGQEEQSVRTVSSPDYVFRSPIYFADSLENRRLPLAKLALSLLFNLALSHHGVALQCQGAGHQASFEAALFHYQLAYNVQIQDGIELSSLHTLGLINNVSQLLNCVGDREGSHQCFEYLLSSMMLHVDQSRGQIEPEVMGLLERFMENVSCAVLNSPSTAQAA